MGYVARGIIRRNGANDTRAGQFVYIAEPAPGWYQWDGEHKAKVYESAAKALAAAAACNGPWFNMPRPRSIKAVSHRSKSAK